MSFEVKPGPTFIRQTRHILKKYPKFKDQLSDYLELLEKNGPMGDRWPKHPTLWKDRLPIKAYNIGARGGIRFAAHYNEEVARDTVVPLLIYLKSEIPNPKEEMIRRAIKELEETQGE